MSAKTYRTVPVRNLSSDELLELSKKQKLSLSREDMEVVQQIFREIDFTMRRLEPAPRVYLAYRPDVVGTLQAPHLFRLHPPQRQRRRAGDGKQPVQNLHQKAFREDHGTQAGLRAQRV